MDYEGLIKKTKDITAKPIFLKNSKQSLKAAKLLFDNNIYLWTIVCSYYSMFYIAQAVLLSLGYKTTGKIVHKVTAEALKDIIKPKLLKIFQEIQDEALEIAEIKSENLVKSFEYERRKRNYIQYNTTEQDIRNKAETSIKRAKEFLFEMEKFP